MGIEVIGGAPAAAKTERTVLIKSTQSWTVPADVSTVEVVLAGGGGGGGAHGVYSVAAGGSGGVTFDVLSVTPSSTHTITVGAGGAKGGDLNSGASGGTTSFGSLKSQLGGNGGGWNAGQGVTGSAGVNLGGASGSGQFGGANAYYSFGYSATAGYMNLGGGGATAGGAACLPTAGGGSFNADGYANTGGGGGGGSAGGNGGSGLVIIKYWSAL